MGVDVRKKGRRVSWGTRIKKAQVSNPYLKKKDLKNCISIKINSNNGNNFISYWAK